MAGTSAAFFTLLVLFMLYVFIIIALPGPATHASPPLGLSRLNPIRGSILRSVTAKRNFVEAYFGGRTLVARKGQIMPHAKPCGGTSAPESTTI